MKSFETFKREMLKNPAIKKEYDALEEEFALINELLRARARAKLTQAQVAHRMGTSQSAVARLESGRAPSLTSLAQIRQGRRPQGGDQADEGVVSARDAVRTKTFLPPFVGRGCDSVPSGGAKRRKGTRKNRPQTPSTRLSQRSSIAAKPDQPTECAEDIWEPIALVVGYQVQPDSDFIF